MWETIALACVADAATIAGILLVKAWRRQALGYSHAINSLAAGLILAASLTALLPVAAKTLGEQAGFYMLGGFMMFLLLETFLVTHAGAEMHRDARTARGMVFFWGLFMHSFLDGISIAVGFAAGTHIGYLIALAVIGHKLPEGITTFSLLLQKLKYRTALGLSVLVAFATPAGALLGVALRPVLPPDALAYLTAIVAGDFMYVAATDIVPEIREERPARNIAFLALGMAALIALHQFMPE